MFRKKDELNKKNIELKNKFKEIAQLVNKNPLFFIKKVKKMENFTALLSQKKFQQLYLIK